MIYAVDFDGLLCVPDYPNIGKPRLHIIAHFKALQAQGHKLILNTCREGQTLQEALEWCEGHGLKFDAVNENLPERIAEFGGDCRKISADFYADDRNYYLNLEDDMEVKGVSPEQEIITNDKGGMQSKAEYGFHLCDYGALFALAETLQIGATRYARDNWKKIPAEEHFNHMMIHALAYLKGDKQDDHLAHMFCRAMMFYATAKEEERKKEEEAEYKKEEAKKIGL